MNDLNKNSEDVNPKGKPLLQPIRNEAVEEKSKGNYGSWIRQNLLSIGFIIAILGGIFKLGSIDRAVTDSQTSEKVFSNSHIISGLQEKTKEIEGNYQIQNKEISKIEEINYYFDNDNVVEAMALIDEFLIGNFSNHGKFMVMEIKARILWRNGMDLDDIIDVGSKMIKLFPEKYNGYHWRGIAEYGKWSETPAFTTHLEKARSDFKKSIEFFPGQLKDKINIVETMIMLGDFQNAAHVIQDVSDNKYLSKFDRIVLSYLSGINEILDNDENDKSYQLINSSIMEFVEKNPRQRKSYYKTDEIRNYVKFKMETDPKNPKFVKAIQLMKVMDLLCNPS